MISCEKIPLCQSIKAMLDELLPVSFTCGFPFESSKHALFYQWNAILVFLWRSKLYAHLITRFMTHSSIMRNFIISILKKSDDNHIRLLPLVNRSATSFSRGSLSLSLTLIQLLSVSVSVLNGMTFERIAFLPWHLMHTHTLCIRNRCDFNQKCEWERAWLH